MVVIPNHPLRLLLEFFLVHSRFRPGRWLVLLLLVGEVCRLHSQLACRTRFAESEVRIIQHLYRELDAFGSEIND